MALQNTRKSNYPEWYQNVIAAADMAELSSSPGCMVIKPWGYGIWERTQHALDTRFKATGHDNAYFPLFIPLSFFQKEATHVKGFAKEMAIVTHSKLVIAEDGKLVPDGKLEEPLVVRPTSETIIGESFARWGKSYRDFPILINQWANVVRWEMRPRLFLRTREFLWQEGHTAHANEQEAREEVARMLEVYADVAENCMGMPVIRGVKPAFDRFPGAEDTYCLESMMQDGRALQAGTSHYLGQKFAKAAEIKFQNAKGEIEYAYTTSWGVSTRLIGGLIMTHADDEGMVVPPKLAPHQIVIVPILDKGRADEVMAYARKLQEALAKQTYDDEKLRVRLDSRDKDSSDRYWEWTRKGAPLVCEIGPRDVDGNALMLRRRTKINTDEWKQAISADKFVAQVPAMLESIQDEMYAAAKKRLDENVNTSIKTVAQMEEYFAPNNAWIGGAGKVGFVIGKWCDDPAVEEKMKEMRISIRCLPIEQSGTQGACLITGKPATTDAIYARSY